MDIIKNSSIKVDKSLIEVLNIKELYHLKLLNF